DDSVSAPAHLADYGLDHPGVQAQFKFKDGSAQTLLVGDKDITGNSVYAKFSGRPEVYLVPDYVVQNLVKTVDDLRDHSLIDTDLVQAGSLRVTADGRTIRVRKAKDNSWDLTAPVSAKADPSKVRDVLTSLNDLRVDRFETDHPSDLKIYGLASPSAVVEVGAAQAGAPDQTLLFGRQKLKTEDVFAKLAGSPTVFLVPQSFVKSLDLKPSDFRDKSLLQFDASQAERLTVSHGGKTIVYVKDAQGRWQAVGRDQANDEGSGILSQLALLTVSDFPGPKADSGTAHPAYRVDVALTGGLARHYAFGNREGSSVYLAVKGNPDLYLVPATAEAPLGSLFGPATPAPTAAK
ncbi:MAG TPA: DUF4340 domain-containing protein, partial [bacterium]|nr:DUF4340 domain-containing protein [bacterium]